MGAGNIGVTQFVWYDVCWFKSIYSNDCNLCFSDTSGSWVLQWLDMDTEFTVTVPGTV